MCVCVGVRVCNVCIYEREEDMKVGTYKLFELLCDVMFVLGLRVLHVCAY